MELDFVEQCMLAVLCLLGLAGMLFDVLEMAVNDTGEDSVG